MTGYRLLVTWTVFIFGVTKSGLVQYLTGTLYTEIMFNKFFNAQPTNLCNCFFNVCTDIETMCVQSLRCSHLILACRESLEDGECFFGQIA